MMTSLVLVGSSLAGKTSLFNLLYESQVGEKRLTDGSDFTAVMKSGRKKVHVTVFDTNSSEEMFDIRRIIYLTADVLIIVFSLEDRLSLEEVETRWSAEVKYHAPGDARLLLIGNKKDVRDEARSEPGVVRYAEGWELAKKIGAQVYLECSCLTRDGLPQVIRHVTKTAAKKKQRTSCALS